MKPMISMRVPNHKWLRTLLLFLGVAWVAYFWTVGNSKQASDCEYVRSLYVGLLDRPPDTRGYKGYCKALISGSMTKDQMLKSFLTSPEYLAKHK